MTSTNNGQVTRVEVKRTDYSKLSSSGLEHCKSPMILNMIYEVDKKTKQNTSSKSKLM